MVGPAALLASSVPVGEAPDTSGAISAAATSTVSSLGEDRGDEASGDDRDPTEEIGEIRGRIESMNEGMLEMKTIVEQLAKVKLSGYIQGRFEWHDDSANGLNAAGKPATTTQFLVRRGRLKASYAGAFAEFLLQVDATGKGVALKDAEATFIEPWTGLDLRLTAGQFKWPFGYEVLQSSGIREMPERTRVIRTLFPGERDRGLRLQASVSFLRLSAALVNGNGTEDTIYGANDQNRFKDIVGRIGADFDGLVFGVSGYWGEGLSTKVGDPKATPPVPSTFTKFDKTRIGIDVEAYVDVPSLGGLALKGEIIRAEELGADPLGFWVLAAQNVGDALGAFVRFDRYDPDIHEGDDAITTLGGGLHYFFSGNVKATAVYEHPISQVVSGGSDPTDDVFTFQIQGMF